MALKLPELSAFAAVARLGSFTRAAVELSVTQPALSRRIRVIEESLGATLFDRLPEGARLTEAGQSFLPFAERALMNLRDGGEAVRGVGSGVRGQVGLAFVGTFANRGLTRAIERFRRENPAVELALYTGMSAEVSDLVRRGDAHLGLRYRPDPDPELESKVIGQEIVEVLCSPKHPLARRKSVTPADLAEEIWVGFPYQRAAPDSGMKRVLMQYGLLSHRFMAIHSSELQIDLIAANFGVGLLPRRTAAQALRSGRLRALKVPAIRNVVPIALVRRKGAYESGASKRLAGILSESIGAASD